MILLVGYTRKENLTHLLLVMGIGGLVAVAGAGLTFLGEFNILSCLYTLS